MDSKPNILGVFYTFESVKQLHARKGWNSFRCVRDIVAFESEIQLWINRIENGRISAFSALNAFAEEVETDFRWIRPIFLESLPTSYRDGQMYPFSQLNQKHVKHFWGARATDLLWSGLHCWTVDWAAKSTAVDSDSIWVDVQSVEPNISDLCPQATETLFLFPTTYRCDAVFQH